MRVVNLQTCRPEACAEAGHRQKQALQKLAAEGMGALNDEPLTGTV